MKSNYTFNTYSVLKEIDQLKTKTKTKTNKPMNKNIKNNNKKTISKNNNNKNNNKNNKNKSNWKEICEKAETIIATSTESLNAETLLELCIQTLMLITLELPKRILNEDKEGFEKIDKNLTKYYETIQSSINTIRLNKGQLDVLYNNILMYLNTYMTMNVKIENSCVDNDDQVDNNDHKICNPNYFSNYKFNFHRLLKLLDQRFYKNKLGNYIKHSIELSNEERTTTRLFCINCDSRYDEVYLKMPSFEISKQTIAQAIAQNNDA